MGERDTKLVKVDAWHQGKKRFAYSSLPVLSRETLLSQQGNANQFTFLEELFFFSPFPSPESSLLAEHSGMEVPLVSQTLY